MLCNAAPGMIIRISAFHLPLSLLCILDVFLLPFHLLNSCFKEGTVQKGLRKYKYFGTVL